MRVAVIINPISGTRRGADAGRRRAAIAVAHLRACGHEPDVRITERAGHARALAAGAAADGAALVCAWGGDGTVNEVGSALVYGDVPLGIIPSGSGNGLARELRMPLDGAAAIDRILSAPSRRIDAGELAGRLFFNVAGLGLDAVVAQRFNASPGKRRGTAEYVRLTIGAAFRYRPPRCAVRWNGERYDARPLVIAIANSRQYGSGAVIAPLAQLDDGALDVVLVPYRSFWWGVLRARALFNGRIGEVPGVRTARATEVTVESDRPLLCHVDGEPLWVGPPVTVRIRPGALLIRAPHV